MTTTSGRKVDPRTRENEFQGEFRAMSEAALMCLHCNYEVDWQKKTSKHIECKLVSTKIM